MANFIPQMSSTGIPNFQQLTGASQISNPYGNVIFTPSPYDNYMGKNTNYSQNPVQFLKCRPVSSKEEAMASQIDLDGSLWVFTDVGNGKIYTKQINNDGTATFKAYEQTTNENTYSTEYVTKDEFNKVVQSLVAAIQSSSSTATQKEEQKKQASKKDQIPLNF